MRYMLSIAENKARCLRWSLESSSLLRSLTSFAESIPCVRLISGTAPVTSLSRSQLDLLRSARGSNNNTSRTTGGATAAASGPKSVTSATSAGQAPFEPKDLSLAQKKKLNLLKARRDRLTRELARMED